MDALRAENYLQQLMAATSVGHLQAQEQLVSERSAPGPQVSPDAAHLRRELQASQQMVAALQQENVSLRHLGEMEQLAKARKGEALQAQTATVAKLTAERSALQQLLEQHANRLAAAEQRGHLQWVNAQCNLAHQEHQQRTMLHTLATSGTDRLQLERELALQKVTSTGAQTTVGQLQGRLGAAEDAAAALEAEVGALRRALETERVAKQRVAALLQEEQNVTATLRAEQGAMRRELSTRLEEIRMAHEKNQQQLQQTKELQRQNAQLQAACAARTEQLEALEALNGQLTSEYHDRLTRVSSGLGERQGSSDSSETGLSTSSLTPLGQHQLPRTSLQSSEGPDQPWRSLSNLFTSPWKARPVTRVAHAIATSAVPQPTRSSSRPQSRARYGSATRNRAGSRASDVSTDPFAGLPTLPGVPELAPLHSEEPVVLKGRVQALESNLEAMQYAVQRLLQERADAENIPRSNSHVSLCG